MDFTFGKNGKLTLAKESNYNISLLELDGVTYQLPCKMNFEQGATKAEVYRDIIKMLAQKYLKVVK